MAQDGSACLRQLPLEELDGIRDHAATRVHDVLSPGLTKHGNNDETQARESELTPGHWMSWSFIEL